MLTIKVGSLNSEKDVILLRTVNNNEQRQIYHGEAMILDFDNETIYSGDITILNDHLGFRCDNVRLLKRDSTNIQKIRQQAVL